MRSEQMRYLEAAIRLGSLRKAAQEVGVGQPTLSQQIRRLEEDLNVVLLIRRANGVLPSAEARILLPHIRQVLQANRALREEAGLINGLRSGSVRLGAVTTASQILLPKVVPLYRNSFPNVRFSVWESGSKAVRESVTSGELDLGLVVNTGDSAADTNLTATDLISDDVVLCVSRRHPLADKPVVTMQDLAGQSWVVSTHGYALRELVDSTFAPPAQDIVYETTNPHTSLLMVGARVGIAMLPRYALRDHCADDVVTPTTDWAPPRLTVCMIRRADTQPSPAVRKLIQVLREVSAEWSHDHPAGPSAHEQRP
ncbi:LysR family transcriptional regulator [Rhodococcus oxybenzonivorans]|jgi:DNA-binding transcriptional LysR family regulator|uniref:LysR family transcriptional regulator n=1 Tax=Rhodococcus TaxID=1827 RepID=UPI00202E2DB8|nr:MULTISPECIES: LysR family transcriptional regulator [Rhodococcus]MDV7352166.1 LysR family transcriptional regulator [Rhodococcus oxybenzonivorans]